MVTVDIPYPVRTAETLPCVPFAQGAGKIRAPTMSPIMLFDLTAIKFLTAIITREIQETYFNNI